MAYGLRYDIGFLEQLCDKTKLKKMLRLFEKKI